jgi:hypothetical protein
MSGNGRAGRPGGPLAGDRLCKTKPIWRGVSSWKSQVLSGQARTSRFPDTPIIPGFHHSMVPVVWQSCKTNPIWPRRPEMGAHGPAASINCAKRSQFPAAPGGARPEGRGSWVDCAERSQFASGRPGEVRGTRAAESNRAKRTQFDPRCPGMGAHGPAASIDCAKRSQFPRPTIPLGMARGFLFPAQVTGGYTSKAM